MPSKYIRKGAAPRAVSPAITLSPEFKHRNYSETIAKMYAQGLVSKETAKTMLERVEGLTAEAP